MEGSVRDLSAVTTGAQVRRDQVLGSVFMPDARAALQAYITALDAQDLDPQQRAHEAMRAFAGTTMSRASQYTVERLRGMGMSLRQIEEMRVRREVPITIDLVSPVDGVVLARSVTPGQKFEKGMEWFRIANLERVWILADLLEGDAALVRAGAPVKVTVPGRAGALTAVVSKVPPIFDPASRTLKVRLELDNPGRALLPDMYVDAEVAVERPAAVVLPVDAVLDSGLRSTVFVERGEGTFEPRQVEVGWRAGGLVEIRSGLTDGERVVVSGTFLVDSESQLRTAALHVQGEGRP
jgi:Cu(I)/Ag(I) efflux system membrane fusion protein